MSAHPALVPALWVSVQLLIAEYEARGGPSEADFARVRGNADVIASGADGMLYRGNKAGHAADVFNVLADALAVMAFVPGGVKFAGEHFAAGPHNQ